VVSAAKIVGAFFKRLGLEIKAVIDFLASLLDWGDVLNTQDHLIQVLDHTLDSFKGLVDRLPKNLAGHIADLQSRLGAPGAMNRPSLPAPQDHSSLGDHFGFLLDKLEAHLDFNLLPSDQVDVGSLQATLSSILDPLAGDLAALSAMCQSAGIASRITSPAALLASGPQAVLDLFQPLAATAIKFVGQVAIGVLAHAADVVSALRALIERPLPDIPVLTQFLKIVVFRGRHDVSPKSIFTLIAAAMLNVIYKLATDKTSVPFPRDDGAVDRAALSFGLSEDQQTRSRFAMVLQCMNVIANLAQALPAFGASSEFSAQRKKEGNIAACLSSKPGILSAVLSAPVGMFIENKLMLSEQVVQFVLNLVGALTTYWDCSLRVASSEEPSKWIRRATGLSGVCMVATAIVTDSIEINKKDADAGLAGFDMANQIISGANNCSAFIEDDATGCMVIGVTSALATGLGIANIIYSAKNPDAVLGKTDSD
jgi:hypothetical protein